MAFLRYIQDLYSLETLDTRFVSSSKRRLPESNPPERAHPDLTGRANGTAKALRPSAASEQASQQELRTATSARWSSLEFVLYYAVFIVAIPLMFKSVYDVSSRE